jgi:histidyl-tRNA synthetase
MATEKITGIRGFNDILGEDSALWRLIEDEAIGIFTGYGFSEIRLPVVEKTELFSRSIGETTDIVEKEMYTFEDRRGDMLTLRPEGTAPAVRAYIENKLYTSPVTRLFYRGPMFRYERPQKGRYRQFYQIGAEVLGDARAGVDAETIEMLVRLFAKLGLKETTLEINSLGCATCRPGYKEALKNFLSTIKKSLCENCLRRIDENPLRALDCKSTGCIEATTVAPSLSEHICPPCSEHFRDTKKRLSELSIAFKVNPRMVRGLDYYTKTTFEITTATGLGAQNTIAAGGRYDGLVSELGGPETPCFGFAIGMERLAIVLNDTPSAKRPKESPLIYFISMGEEATQKSIELVGSLREKGERVVSDIGGDTLKHAMKKADRIGASYAVILGQSELEDESVQIKELSTAKQESVAFDKLSEYFKNQGGS